MNFKRLVLASQSPRRREMIAWLGIPFHTCPADVSEKPQPGEKPAALAARLASLKAKAISNIEPRDWVLSADTVVELDAQALGKPQNSEQAYVMLNQLQGRAHQVHTGVALYNPSSARLIVRRVTTQVWMRQYTDTEIATYVATRDPLDKAGAYAIQNTGFQPVARLSQCYTNVVGLPLCAVAALLRAWGHMPDTDIPALCYTHFGYHCTKLDEGARL